MTALHFKNRLHNTLKFSMVCIALGGINLAYAGAGHGASSPKADCGSLKTMLDNGVAPDDIAKDKLVMQAMMTKCQAALKPSAEHSGHHASPADSGAESNHSMHGSKTSPAKTATKAMGESSPKAMPSDDDGHGQHQH
jgi:hypothetical protein